MDIIIIADFCRKFDGQTNNRFLYIADKLSKDNEVEVISSDFEHQTKQYFKDVSYMKYNFKITLLHEPIYRTNICLKRFYAHFIWGVNVYRFLKKRKKADIIYCAVPTLTSGYLVSKYCKKNNIRFIIDIQDLWPEAYKMIFNVPVISDIVFAPFKFLADNIYRSADEIVAVSQTYLDRALCVNDKIQNGYSVYLGNKLSEFDFYKNNENISNLIENKNENLWLAYCGMLGSSYDLKYVIDALAILKERKILPPIFIVMGDGPKKNEFELYAKNKNVKTLFLGSLPYEKMCALLCKCDFVVNPILKGSAGSIINKHSDYAASGLPVLNTQESVEYRNLINKFNMGFNCKNNDPNDFSEKLHILIKKDELRKKMGKNARLCAEENFDKNRTYTKIFELFKQKNR